MRVDPKVWIDYESPLPCVLCGEALCRHKILDACLLRHRALQTDESAATLRQAMEDAAEDFMEEQTIGYQARTH